MKNMKSDCTMINSSHKLPFVTIDSIKSNQILQEVSLIFSEKILILSKQICNFLLWGHFPLSLHFILSLHMDLQKHANYVTFLLRLRNEQEVLL